MLLSSSLFAAEANLQTRLSKLERMVDNRGLINILNEMEDLQREVRELRGEIEQQAYTIDQMKKRQQSLYDDLDQRIQTGQNESFIRTEENFSQEQSEVENIDQKEQPSSLPLTAITTDVTEAPGTIPIIEEPDVLPTNKTRTISSIQPVETYVAQQKTEANSSTSERPSQTRDKSEQTSKMVAGSNEESNYSEAFNLLKQGHHDKAVDKFRTFLQEYPGSDYADNAQYWLGESFYAKHKFETAIDEYKELLSRYPNSGKVSHAQLKIGYCYDELGQTDFAQGELEDLIARYPGTSAASLAEERLALIRSH